MTIIRLDTLQPWQGEPLPFTTTSATVHRLDGTVEEITVEPYTFDVRHPPNIGDIWSDEELRAVGLCRAQPFVAPEGKRVAGGLRYELVDSVVHEVMDVEDIPPPPPPLTAQEKLAAVGLTPDDLKTLLEQPAQ